MLVIIFIIILPRNQNLSCTWQLNLENRCQKPRKASLYMCWCPNTRWRKEGIGHAASLRSFSSKAVLKRHGTQSKKRKISSLRNMFQLEIWLFQGTKMQFQFQEQIIYMSIGRWIDRYVIWWDQGYHERNKDVRLGNFFGKFSFLGSQVEWEEELLLKKSWTCRITKIKIKTCSLASIQGCWWYQ